MMIEYDMPAHLSLDQRCGGTILWWTSYDVQHILKDCVAVQIAMVSIPRGPIDNKPALVWLNA